MKSSFHHTEKFKRFQSKVMSRKWKDLTFRKKMLEAYKFSHHKVRYFPMNTYPHIVLDISL